MSTMVFGGAGFIIAIIVIVALVAVIFKLSYVKSPPDRAALISGLSKKSRVLLGRAGFKVPFFERVDWLEVGQLDIDIRTDDYIPTRDFINIQVDAIAQVSIDVENGIEQAGRNFLNKKPEAVKKSITASLQGNLREIIGTMDLKDICQNKTQFSQEVRENAEGDMARLGLRILSFNVQNVNDKDGLIDDLGIDNRSQIQKSAQIAKANADRDVEMAKAQANNESSKAKVASDTAIAERENQLAIKKAELKMSEDTKKAEADAAYKIQEETSRRAIEVKTQEADIARREKEIELQAREAEVAQQKLVAEVEKPAEARKFAAMQDADADLYKRKKDAEAKLYEQQKEAEAIEAKGKAEAEAIRLKGEAEAEAMDKRAEAMKKYGQAAILEMIVGVLPEMAKAVAEPISAIDEVKIIGSDGNGVSEMGGNVPIMLAKVMESVKETTGIDMMEIVKANTYDAKVKKEVTIDGSIPVEHTEVLSDDATEGNAEV